MDKTILPGRVKGTLTPPCSKSYAQRALAAALLCEGVSQLRNIEFCNDTRSALRCIETLGAEVRQEDASTLVIRGGLRPRGDRLHVGESGLATRLFTPVAALCEASIRIEGEGSILDRPMRMMVEPLRSLGVEISDTKGHLPIRIRGPIRGGEVHLDGSVSSQFLTGLLLSLPVVEKDTTVYVENPVSLPYIDMTIDTARRFGVTIEHKNYTEYYIEGGQHYTPVEFHIEGDWSSAASMLVAGAVAGEVTVDNLNRLSLQADYAIIKALMLAGAEILSTENSVTVRRRELKAFEFDATNCPDLFPALAALAANCRGTSVIRGTSRLLHKESNRALTIAEEYEKAGIEVDISQDDIMRIRGGQIRGCCVDSHGDHRIAMSMAVAALTADSPITIRGAECVAKSYPSFFEDLAELIC